MGHTKPGLTGVQHYMEATELVIYAGYLSHPPPEAGGLRQFWWHLTRPGALRRWRIDRLIAAAQVHATLANAAATALSHQRVGPDSTGHNGGMPDRDYSQWQAVAGNDR